MDRVFRPWIRLFSLFGGMVGVVLVAGWFRWRDGYPILTHVLLMPPGIPAWWKVLLPGLSAALVVLWILAAKTGLEIVEERATIGGAVGRLWAERPALVLLLAPAAVLVLALILPIVAPLAFWLRKSQATKPEPLVRLR